jgi:hypothetical protein
MLYSEIIVVCSEIHTKHINTLCGQNVECVCLTWRYVKLPLGFKRLILLSDLWTSLHSGPFFRLLRVICCKHLSRLHHAWYMPRSHFPWSMTYYLIIFQPLSQTVCSQFRISALVLESVVITPHSTCKFHNYCAVWCYRKWRIQLFVNVLTSRGSISTWCRTTRICEVTTAVWSIVTPLLLFLC